VRPRLGDQAGQVTAFVVVFALTVIFVAGLVFDGGYVLAARRRALNEAEAAARVGADALVVEQYRGSGGVSLDPALAVGAAQSYLAETGHSGTVRVVGDRVVVDVSFAQPLQILGVAGIGAMTVSGTGEARAVRGLEVEG
jgi:hypothetical protein